MSGLAIVSPDLTFTAPNYEETSALDSAVVKGKTVKTKNPQTAELKLRVSYSLYAWRASAKRDEPVEKFLLVSLEGSSFRPGKLMYDQADRRGWFTESVAVEISFPSAPPKTIFCQNDSPPSTTAAGSASVSSGINFSVGSGFFGKEQMGNADVGGSISNTFSESLQDFEIVNNSSAHVMSHLYRLAMLRGGVPFRVPSDIVEQDAGGWFKHFFGDGAAPGRLYDLPPRSTSNLPLISQVLFRAQRPLNTAQEMQIQVTTNLLMVEKTFVGVAIDHTGVAKKLVRTRAMRVPFDRVI